MKGDNKGVLESGFVEKPKAARRQLLFGGKEEEGWVVGDGQTTSAGATSYWREWGIIVVRGGHHLRGEGTGFRRGFMKKTL